MAFSGWSAAKRFIPSAYASQTARVSTERSLAYLASTVSRTRSRATK